MSYKRLVARVPLQHCFTNQTFRSITLAHTHTHLCVLLMETPKEEEENEEEKEDEDKAEDDAAGKKTQRS